MNCGECYAFSDILLSNNQYLPNNSKNFSKFLYILYKLMKDKFKSLTKHMEQLNLFKNDKILFKTDKYNCIIFISRRLFMGYLDLKSIIRLMNCIVNEGAKILYRIWLGIFAFALDDLLKTKTLNEFNDCLIKIITNGSIDTFLSKGFDLYVTRDRIKKLSLKYDKRCYKELFDTSINLRITLPNIMDIEKSSIITNEVWYWIWQSIPMYLQLKNPILLFNANNDGYILNSMIKILKLRACLVFIKTTLNDIIGAFIPIEDEKGLTFIFGIIKKKIII